MKSPKLYIALQSAVVLVLLVVFASADATGKTNFSALKTTKITKTQYDDR